LLRGIGWAWALSVEVYIVSVPLGLVEIVAGGSTGLVGGTIRTIVGLVFAYYLTRPNVKSFLGRGGIASIQFFLDRVTGQKKLLQN